MSRVARRLLCASVLGAMLSAACSPEAPLAPEEEAAPAPQARPSVQAVPNEYIVIFHDGVRDPPGLAGQLAQAHGLKLRHTYTHAVQGFAAFVPPQALNGLRNNPRIRLITPNLTYTLSTPHSALEAPSDLTTAASAGRIDLSWTDNSADERGMEVWRSTSGPSGAFSKLTRLRKNSEAYADQDVVDGTEYCYYIVAVWGRDSSEPSNIACATPGAPPPPPPEPPAAPTGLGATATGETTIDLAWTDASSDEDGFRIERRLGQAGTWGEIATTVPDATAFGDSGLTAETEYCYRVRAFNEVGDSADSNIACATTAAPPPPPPPPPEPPAAPTGLGATATGETTIDLAWTDASSDEDGFRIERRLGQAGTWGAIATTVPDATAFGDSGLTAETEYYYRVRAFNEVGDSADSNIACATTEAASGSLPAPIPVPTSGLRVRLVANDLAAGDVTSWPNRGSEGDAVQADAARRPTFHGASADFGGNASVGFNEGADSRESLTIGGVASHSSGTLIVVFHAENSGAPASTVFAPYGSSGSRTNMVTSRDGLSLPMDYSTTSMGVWFGGTLTPAPGATHIGVWRIEAGEFADMQLDGADAGGRAGSFGFPGFDRYIVGLAQPSSSERFDGRMAEILFYDRALSNCERDAIVADLGAHYAVPVAVTGGVCSPPADPTGLTATAVSHNGIDLAWTDASSDEDGFRVERRLGQTGDWTAIATTGPGATTYESRGLLQETEYCYRVQAFNADGSSQYSNTACATTEAAPPLPAPITVPTSGLRVRLVANDLAAGDVTSWPNRGSEGDAVQADAARRPTFHGASADFGGNASVGFNEGADSQESLTIGGVASHSSGTLIVVFHAENSGAPASTVFAPYGSSGSRTNMVTSRDGLSLPMDYSTTSMGVWFGGTLTPAPGATHIGVWRIEAGEFADMQLDGADAGGRAGSFGFPGFDRYIVGMAQPSSSERFDGRMAEILFYDRALVDCERDAIVAGLGAHYAVPVAVTGGVCSPPADPTGLSATAVTYNGIDLAWTDASSDEDGFRVERRLGQTDDWSEIATTGPDAGSYESRGLVQETEYCYRVQAFNADGDSKYSNIACAVTEAAPPGACVDTGNHDDLSELYGIAGMGAPTNQVWASTQQPGCEITAWYFGLDSGVDSDHPDLNVVEAISFVAAEPGHDGEDRNGHGTHTAGSAAALDGNGGVVGVAPGAPIHSFRVCEDGGSCQSADMIAAMDEVIARKLANPDQPMVANMSIGGPPDPAIDLALRNSINAGIVYAVAAGNGVFGACIFPADAAGVSPARVGDDEIDSSGGSAGDDGLLNGVITTTSHNSAFADVNCNYGAPVSVAAPGFQIKSTWLNGGYNTISGTSMATPHVAGAALLYLQVHPEATPAEVEAAIVSRLEPWTTDEQPNAAGRLYVGGP